MCRVVIITTQGSIIMDGTEIACKATFNTQDEYSYVAAFLYIKDVLQNMRKGKQVFEKRL